MKLTELVSYLFLSNGQYIVGELESVDLNVSQFWNITKAELLKYQRYNRIEKRFNLTCSTTSHIFTVDSEPLGIPGWISDVNPIGFFNLVTMPFFSNFNRKIPGPNDLKNPAMAPWRYFKPKLILPSAGKYDICAHYDYDFTLESTGNVVTDVDIPGLDLSHYMFLDLMSARFKITIGSSRRAFTYKDLPITTDAEALVAEGTAAYEVALQQIYNNHPWHLGVRP